MARYAKRLEGDPYLPPKKMNINREDRAKANSVCKDIIYNLEFWSGLAIILPTTAEGLKARTMALGQDNILQNFFRFTFP